MLSTGNGICFSKCSYFYKWIFRAKRYWGLSINVHLGVVGRGSRGCENRSLHNITSIKQNFIYIQEQV